MSIYLMLYIFSIYHFPNIYFQCICFLKLFFCGTKVEASINSQIMMKSVNKTPRNVMTQFKTISFITPSLNSVAFKTYPWQGIVSWSGTLDSSSCWYAGPTIPPSLLRGEGGVLLKAFLWSIPLLCPGLQQEERVLLVERKPTNTLITAITSQVAAETFQALHFHPRSSKF